MTISDVRTSGLVALALRVLYASVFHDGGKVSVGLVELLVARHPADDFAAAVAPMPTIEIRILAGSAGVMWTIPANCGVPIHIFRRARLCGYLMGYFLIMKDFVSTLASSSN